MPYEKPFVSTPILQVGSDSILLCSVIYKFVITNVFNCHGTIAYICNYKFRNNPKPLSAIPCNDIIDCYV